MWRDLERLCLKQQIPFKHPTIFPRNGLLAVRITYFYDKEAWISKLIKLVFQANFIFDQNIADRQIISDCLAKCGQNPDEVMNYRYTDRVIGISL